MALNDEQIEQLKVLIQGIKSGAYGKKSDFSMQKICQDLWKIDDSFKNISSFNYYYYGHLNDLLRQVSGGDIKEENISYLFTILRVPSDKHEEFKSLIMSPVQKTSGAGISSSSSNNTTSVSAASDGINIEKIKKIFLDARRGDFLDPKKGTEGANNFINRLQEAGVSIEVGGNLKLRNMQNSLNFIAGKENNSAGLAVVNLRAALKNVIRDENIINSLLKDAKGWIDEMVKDQQNNKTFSEQYTGNNNNIMK